MVTLQMRLVIPWQLMEYLGYGKPGLQEHPENTRVFLVYSLGVSKVTPQACLQCDNQNYGHSDQFHSVLTNILAPSKFV